jgi:cell division protein FtsB
MGKLYICSYKINNGEIPMKKFLKLVFIIALLVYATITLCNQQKTLNTYKLNKENLSDQINEQEEQKEELLATKENINSKEFIEEYVRENSGMYYPNEIVFENVGL